MLIQGNLLILALSVAAAYLAGCIPTGIIVSSLFGRTDPRTVGSKNIGATNVARSAGRLAGVITLVGDIIKGAVPVILAMRYQNDARFVSLVAIAAFLGHVFPVFLGFKGGKGVATACGVMLVISPPATLLSACIFVILLLIKKYVSLGSMAAAAAMPVFLSFFTDGKPYVPLSVAISVLVILKHGDNIKRILAGAENRFGGK